MTNATLIKCGRLYDGIHDSLEPNMEILVKGNRIVAVGQNLNSSYSAEIVDLSDCTVTPGLIDAHVHMQHFNWHKRRDEILLRGTAWKGMAFLYNARECLHRGFTTIRAVGSSTYDARGGLVAKELINQGYFTGSRLCVLPNYMCTLGSHGDHSQYIRTNPEISDFMAKLTPTMGTGVDFFRNAVRNEIKMGADYIKMMINGGFSTPHDSPDDQQMGDEEIKTVIDTTHELGKTCTAHIYNSDQMRKVALMGIDGMEHGSLITEETARIMEDLNVYLVPTFCPYDDIIEINEETLSMKSPQFAAKLRQYANRLKKGREVIINSKLRLGYGTDFVAVHHPYENGYEFESWINSGISPYRALKAATSINADILQMDEVGSIQVNKLADIAAWKRDPLTDPKALLDCAFVMKDGAIYSTTKVE